MYREDGDYADERQQTPWNVQQERRDTPVLTNSISGGMRPQINDGVYLHAGDNSAPMQSAQPAATAPSTQATTQTATQQWTAKAAAPASTNPQPDMPQITARNPQWGALYDQLMNRSKQSLAVDPNDPLIKGQVDAANVIGRRNMQQDVEAAAERGGAYATGATGNYARHSAEQFGAQQANMQAQLMSREVDARRQEIAQALSGMSGLLTAEETSRLKQQDQALQAKQMQLGAQQNAWDNAYKDRSLAAQMADAAAGRGSAASIAGARLAFDQSNAAQQQANWENKFGWDQAQTLRNNDYQELFGGSGE